MSRRVRFGSTTSGTLDALDGQIDTGNEDGNNPDNDLVIRDSNSNIVMRYDESAEAWTLANNDLTGVGALETESLDTGIEEPSDVSGDRSFNTEFQNTIGRTIEWTVVGECDTGESIDMRPDVGAVSGSLSNLQDLELNDADGRTRLSFTHLIPDGHYYQIREFGDTTIRKWHERALER